MPEILIASLSPVGHIAPLLNVAQGLVDRGDRVTVLSSADHAAKIRDVGATPAAHSAGGRLRPDPPRHRPARARRNLWHQAASTSTSSDCSSRRCRTRPACCPELMAPYTVRRHHRRRRLLRRSCRSCSATARARPPVLVYTTTPLMVSSRDTAPSGTGPAAVVERARAAAQPHAEPAVAEGVAAPIAERRQLPAAIS